jgi:hypothetical protein
MRNVAYVWRVWTGFGRFWGSRGHSWLGRRRLLISSLLLVLGLPVGVVAQTTIAKMAWTQPLIGGQTLTDVQAFAYSLKVDNGTPVALTATCVAPVAPATNPTCSATLPLITGSHSLTLTATNAFGSATSDPISVGPPAKPILITVTYAQVP